MSRSPDVSKLFVQVPSTSTYRSSTVLMNSLETLEWYLNLLVFYSVSADIVVDVDTLNEDQIQQFNVCGTAYGMGKQDYIK
jgi:hypothetical protein